MSDGPYPSLSVAEAELDRVDASYQTRAQSLDGKVGFLLGFAGVLVALGTGRDSVTVTVAPGCSLAAGAAAVWTRTRRVSRSPNARPCRRRAPIRI